MPGPWRLASEPWPGWSCSCWHPLLGGSACPGRRGRRRARLPRSGARSRSTAHWLRASASQSTVSAGWRTRGRQRASPGAARCARAPRRGGAVGELGEVLSVLAPARSDPQARVGETVGLSGFAVRGEGCRGVLGRLPARGSPSWTLRSAGIAPASGPTPSAMARRRSCWVWVFVGTARTLRDFCRCNRRPAPADRHNV